MDVRVRQAGSGDLEVLTTLLGELFSMEDDFAKDRERQLRGLKMMLDRGRRNCCVKVAEVDGRVVGLCTVQILISTAEGGLVGLVEDLVVDSGFRGRGIGRLLLEHIEAWSSGRGATRLQLLADRTNVSALGFYDKRGWESTRLICLRRKWSQTNK